MWIRIATISFPMCSSGHDGSISIERMVQVYNADLANTWGNLVSRVFNMTNKYFDGVVPTPPAGAEDNPAR